ncbi:putative porin/adhesin family protein [Rickettsiales endosymbiont of Paramecium tredecaurelia]|uniref:hypothetical protein n=1 Tax=Candidatus Sarmatiella mevalonica TaxID=2770581 RepID=UPI0019223921|nr:hypothetical protein [Candidatus Sarmatiella mevalonica]MBL3285164.1 putative porin/adhesin family protein [Candidatus Sarmatiella mevalonica]
MFYLVFRKFRQFNASCSFVLMFFALSLPSHSLAYNSFRSNQFVAQDSFYIKFMIGTRYAKDIDLLNLTSANANGGNSGRSSAQNLFLSGGIGYNVLDSVRMDITYNSFGKTNNNSSLQWQYQAEDKTEKEKYNAVNTSKQSYSATGVMFNGYMDIYDFNIAKLFCGFGVGYSHIKTKIDATITSNLVITDPEKQKTQKNVQLKYNGSLPDSKNCALQFSVGFHFPVQDKMRFELVLSYNMLGKIKTTNITPTVDNVGDVNLLPLIGSDKVERSFGGQKLNFPSVALSIVFGL